MMRSGEHALWEATIVREAARAELEAIAPIFRAYVAGIGLAVREAKRSLAAMGDALAEVSQRYSEVVEAARKATRS